MKVAVLFFVVTAVCAAPEFGTERKYDVSQDVAAQQLNYESDAASLPWSSQESGEGNSNVAFEGALIPVKLVYETNIPTEGSTKIQRGNDDLSIKRVSRSNEISNDILLNNHIPFSVAHVEAPENPTLDMYNDNFGGEHDSQEEMISQDEVNKQILNYNSEGHTRALKMGTKDGIFKETSLPITNDKAHFIPSNSESRILRKIHNYQYVIVPTLSFRTAGNSQGSEALSRTIHPSYHQPHIPPQGDAISANPLFSSSPSHSVWSSHTTVFEYDSAGHPENIRSRRRREAPVKKSRKLFKRDTKSPDQREKNKGSDYQEFFVEDLTRTGGGGSGPKVFRLKVRRGGVAIAGPGGIATAGSGGTAIVGPGGTAYTTQDGTAVVGPGGRVIELPSNFKPTAVEGRNDDPSKTYIPTEGKIIANGPFVYYGALMHGSTFTPTVVRQ